MLIYDADKELLRESSGRRDFDFYETPQPLADRAMRWLAEREPQHSLILDPGAGRGMWGFAAGAVYPDAMIWGVELQDIAAPKGYAVWDNNTDYLRFPEPTPGTQDLDLVIGNPPYRLAQQFVELSLSLVRPGGSVFFLLPLSFLATQKRGRWLIANPPVEVAVLVERPSFTGAGTDMSEYGLYLWKKPFSELARPSRSTDSTRLSWISWR